jgi:pimeloyl-ACP methyl ester carboxylesterase
MSDYRLVPLADGRRLEIAESGPPDAPVLLYIHGTPGGAYQSASIAADAHERGLRLVTMSRAGYAASDRRPGRTVADVVEDAAAVLDAVGAGRAFVAGVSGGGPHALACAALLPERVRATLVAAGVAPYDADGLDWLAGMGEENVIEFGAALDGEDALRGYLVEQVRTLRTITPDGLVAQWETNLPPADRACLSSEVGEEFVAGVHHALSGTIDGWVDDDLAFTRPWGFDLATIRRPVTIWHGGVDLMVPFAHGTWLAEHVPGARSHFDPVEGHLSIRVAHLGEMLDDLVSLGD